MHAFSSLIKAKKATPHPYCALHQNDLLLCLSSALLGDHAADWEVFCLWFASVIIVSVLACSCTRAATLRRDLIFKWFVWGYIYFNILCQEMMSADLCACRMCDTMKKRKTSTVTYAKCTHVQTKRLNVLKWKWAVVHQRWPLRK